MCRQCIISEIYDFIIYFSGKFKPFELKILAIYIGSKEQFFRRAHLKLNFQKHCM